MADPGIKLELATAKFNRMLEDLASIDPSIEFRDVVMSEAASVMAGAAGRTKAASVAKIKARVAGQKFTTYNGKLYYIDRNYRDPELLGYMQNHRVLSEKRKLAARGLSKQSFVWTGKSLGKPIKAPAYVTNANYNGRQYPQDGASTQDGSGNQFAVTVINSSPIVQRANGRWALFGAISGRVRYFERNMAAFAFRSLASRVKKYPGIYAQPPPAPTPYEFSVPDGMY